MNVLIQIVQLVPVLINAIKAIEEAIPGKGAGEAKLAAIRGILEQADASYNEIWPKLQGVIGVLVALFNATAWKK